MGVYIKGMKMPKKSVALILLPDGSVHVFRDDIDHDEWLNAIELPPHGRLIDADALIATHKEICSRSMKFNLDLAPTVIPASEEGET